MSKRKGRKRPRRSQFIKHYTVHDPTKHDVSNYRGHMRSAERGEVVPIQMDGTIIGQAQRWEGVKPKYVMPEKGYQIPELRDNAPPFIRVLLKLWQSDRQQGIEEFHPQKFPHPTIKGLLLFVSGNEYIWGYYGEDQVGSYLRLSIPFVGRGPALDAYKRGLDPWWIKRRYKNTPS